MRIVSILGMFVLVVMLLGGCAMFMQRLGTERPTVTVRSASITAAGFAGLQGAVVLDVTNPNGVGIPLSGVDWELSIGGARAVTGAVELSQTIPAHATAPVTTSLTVAAADAVNSAVAIARGARDYQLAMRLHFATSLGTLDIDVAHSGTLDSAGTLLRLP